VNQLSRWLCQIHESPFRQIETGDSSFEIKAKAVYRRIFEIPCVGGSISQRSANGLEFKVDSVASKASVNLSNAH
jgi:hypothetical protein